MVTVCQHCGLPVSWENIGPAAKPRWQCFNPDGSAHWDLCSRERFARVKREGRYFEKADKTIEVAGYKSPERTQLVSIRPLKPEIGKRWKEDGCNCGKPPWDLCEPACPHALTPRRGA